MTIKEAQRKKSQLEQDIIKLIHTFEIETNLKVDSVEFKAIYNFIENYKIDVKIKNPF